MKVLWLIELSMVMVNSPILMEPTTKVNFLKDLWKGKERFFMDLINLLTLDNGWVINFMGMVSSTMRILILWIRALIIQISMELRITGWSTGVIIY